MTDNFLGNVTVQPGNTQNTTSWKTVEDNSAAIKSDLDTVVTNTNKIPASPATEGGHLAVIDTSTAASKADLDTIVTNTNKIPASPATEGGHLATIDTSTAASKTDLDTLVTQTLTPNVSDRWARQVGQFDLARVLGAALSVSNPAITESNLRNMERTGNGFYATTEELAPANANTAYSIFNPVASGKTIVLHSIIIQYGTASQFARLRIVNTNPSYAVTLSAANFNSGNTNSGSVTAPVASVTYATATTTAPSLSAASLAYGVHLTSTAPSTELLTNNKIITLTAGTGLVIYYSNTAAGTLVVSFYWMEY